MTTHRDGPGTAGDMYSPHPLHWLLWQGAASVGNGVAGGGGEGGEAEAGVPTVPLTFPGWECPIQPPALFLQLPLPAL